VTLLSFSSSGVGSAARETTRPMTSRSDGLGLAVLAAAAEPERWAMW
jgi:hypothetical protein